MRKIGQMIKYYALWTIPINEIIASIVIYFFPKVNHKVVHVVALCIALLTSLIIWSEHHIKMKNGKDISKMGVIDGFIERPDRYSFCDGRHEAMYPSIPSKYLVKKENARGYVFGSPVGDNKHLVEKRFDDTDGSSILVLGGAGSGKTQVTLNYVALNLKNDYVHTFLFDPKGEFKRKVYSEGDNTILFNPHVRTNQYWGYDPFFKLSKKERNTEQEVYDVMNMVSLSLIGTSGGDTAFFELSARNIFCGLLVYFYYFKEVKTLPAIVRKIRSKPLEMVIREAVTDVPQQSQTYLMLMPFVGIAAETLSSFDANLNLAISKYGIDQDLIYALDTCRYKFSPERLLEANVIVDINLVDLKKLSSLVVLMLNQFIEWTLELPDKADDPTRKPMVLVVEEMTAFLSCLKNVTGSGRIEELAQGLRFSRSKGLSFICIAQSLSAIKMVYEDENEVDDMITNFQYLLVLQAKDKSTVDWLCQNMIGKFDRKNVVWNGSGVNQTTSTSFSEESICRPQDLAALDNEAILLTPNGYYRVEKVYGYMNQHIQQYLNYGG